ncbi:g6656 [Coccomyxa elongata]
MSIARSVRVTTASSGVRANSAQLRSSASRFNVAFTNRSALQQRRSVKLGNRLITRAETKDVDFDAILSGLADKFEKSNNKAAIVGWTAAGVGAFFVTEWLLHLPLLDVLLGFPVQLIGVAALPYFYVKYVIEGDSLVDDVGAAAKKVTKELPGLE